MEGLLNTILSDPWKYLPIVGVAAGLLFIFAVWLTNRIRTLWHAVPLQIRRMKPLARPDEKQPVSQFHGDLQAAIVAFIADDPLRRLAPGSMQRVAPRTLAQESFSPWIQILLIAWSIATRRPALEVSLDQLSFPNRKGRWSVVARISRQPGGRVIAAESFSGTAEELAEKIGTFCLNRVRRQRYVVKRTPEWERWTTDRAYLEYRKGLKHRSTGLELRALWKQQERQIRRRENEAATGSATDDLAQKRQADLARLRRQLPKNKAKSDDNLLKALRHFTTACRYDRTNVIPRLAAASLRELIDEYWTAIGLYLTCHGQWPALIEVEYRLLATVDKRKPDAAECRERADTLLRNIETALAMPHLRELRNKSKSLRRYVHGLLRRRKLIGAQRLSKRDILLNGAKAARLTVLMWNLTMRKGGDTRGLTEQEARVEVRKLFESQAELHGVPRQSALAILLHSRGATRRDHHRDPADHDGVEHQEMIRTLVNMLDSKRSNHVGWLAHYNAACFFSFASLLPPELMPWNTTAQCWVEDCVAAACRQIRHVYWDPASELDPNWTDDDADLKPIWDALQGDAMPRELSESMRWMIN